MSTPRRAAEITAGLVVGLLGVRGALVTFLHVFGAIYVRRTTPPALTLVLWLAVAIVGLGLARMRWTDAPRSARAAATALTLATITPLWAWSWSTWHEGYLSWPFAPDRELGRFPHEGGRVIEEDRAGWHMVAHVLPDGTRDCGSADARTDARSDARTVAFVGDSFVFGSGIPDDGTICWQTRTRLPEMSGWRWVNLGQPGAAFRSDVDNARFALDVHGADVVVVGVLAGDDTRAFDLNNQRAVVHSLPFQLIGGALDPPALWELITVAYEAWPPDLLPHAALQTAMDDLAKITREAGVPLILYLQPTPGWKQRGGGYERVMGGLQAAEPDRVRFLVVDVPDQIDGQPTTIPGDGHPTPAGTAVVGDALAAAIQELVR